MAKKRKRKNKKNIELTVKELIVILRENLIGNIAVAIYNQPLLFTNKKKEKLLNHIEESVADKLDRFFSKLKEYLKK